MQIKLITTFLTLFLFTISIESNELLTLSPKIQKVISDAEFSSDNERITAIKTCGIEKITPCYRVLLANLKDTSIKVRDLSAISLGQLQREGTIPYIQEAINEMDAILKEHKRILPYTGAAIEALQLESKEQLLLSNDEIELLQEDRYNLLTKKNMIRSLGLLHQGTYLPIQPDLVTYLEKFLQDEDYEVRGSAAYSLSILKQTTSKDVLTTLLATEKNEYTKVEILNALITLEPYQSNYQQQLCNYLFSTDIKARLRVASIIQNHKIKSAERSLYKALSIESIAPIRVTMLKAYKVITN